MKKIVTIIASVMLLAGCAVTDRVKSRVEAFDDRALEALLIAEEAAEREIERLRKAKCLFPYPAILRLARSSEKLRKAVLEDCNLSVSVDAVAVGLSEDG